MNDEGGRAYQPGLTGGPPPVDGDGGPYVLTINGGSSSLKFAVFAAAGPIERVVSGRVERIGHEKSRLVVSEADGSRGEDRPVDAPDEGCGRRTGHRPAL